MADEPSSPSVQPAHTRISVLLHAAWPRLLLPASVLVQVAIEPAVAPIPNCATWLRGALGQRGAILPVFDVAAWAGETLADLRHSPVVIVDSGPRAFALVCAATPEVIEARASTAPATDGLPASLHPFLDAALSAGDRILASFEVRRWIADSAPSLVA
jgi:chemotaxis signal transduction protein